MRTLFLDCDGVLADFDRGAARVFGMPPRVYERRFGLQRFWAALASAPGFFAPSTSCRTPWSSTAPCGTSIPSS